MLKIGTVRDLWRYPVKAMGGERLESCAVERHGLEGDRRWALRDQARSEIQSCKTRPQLLQCRASYRGGRTDRVDISLPDGTAMASDDPGIHARLSQLVGHASTLEPLRPASDEAFFRRHKKDGHTWLKELEATFAREDGEPLPDLAQLPAILVDHVSVPGTFFLVTPFHILTTATLDRLNRLNPAANFDARRFRPNLVIETDPQLDGLVEQEWIGRRIATGGATLTVAGATPRCGAITRAQQGLAFDAGALRTVVREADQNAGVYADIEKPGHLRTGDDVFLLDA